MSQIVRLILKSDSISLESVFPNIVSDSEGVEVYRRKACVGTLQEINTIVRYAFFCLFAIFKYFYRRKFNYYLFVYLAIVS